jgi:ABC-2 type transport system ATP-binding protein
VLLSTHVLSEVEHTCARLLIINAGRVVADGPVGNLVRRAQGLSQVYVEIAGEGVLQALRSVPGVAMVEPEPATDGRVTATLTVEGDTDIRPEVFRLAKASDWTLYELHQVAGSLESLFRQLTEGPPPA